MVRLLLGSWSCANQDRCSLFLVAHRHVPARPASAVTAWVRRVGRLLLNSSPIRC